ncbi:MAG: hypothetical protein JSW06_03225 [Thermoplasmatales archaeon]|nr:MAG: hypothetical protein JSW06_03225 [Thermoplasmatales archaeon]
MNKKLIIGSIIAAVILVLVSFTGVVGYQTTSTSITRTSPLFKIRTNRAIGEESKDITCRYVGKGNTLPFPKKNDKWILTQKIIDKIGIIDKKTFEKFIAFLINHIQKDKRFNDEYIDKIKEALYLLRKSDKPLPIFDVDIENKLASVIAPIATSCCTFGIALENSLFCLLMILLSPFIAIIKLITAILDGLFNQNCGAMSLISVQLGCTAMN